MSGSIVAQIVIPIVVFIALFSWLTAVLYAADHPKIKHHSNLPKYEVTGGAFEARDGGRQLMPMPGQAPLPPGAVPSPRTEAAGQEQAQQQEQHAAAGSDRRLADQWFGIGCYGTVSTLDAGAQLAKRCEPICR